MENGKPTASHTETQRTQKGHSTTGGKGWKVTRAHRQRDSVQARADEP